MFGSNYANHCAMLYVYQLVKRTPSINKDKSDSPHRKKYRMLRSKTRRGMVSFKFRVGPGPFFLEVVQLFYNQSSQLFFCAQKTSYRLTIVAKYSWLEISLMFDDQSSSIWLIVVGLECQLPWKRWPVWRLLETRMKFMGSNPNRRMQKLCLFVIW